MQRRTLLTKLLTTAIIVGSTAKVLGESGNRVEIKQSKQYLFKFQRLDKEKLGEIKAYLISKGFKDPIVVSGDLDIYEIDNPS